MGGASTSAVASTIGKALVEEGVITEAQLNRALRTQRLLEEPKHLGDVLVGLGFANRQAVNDVIAKHGGSMRLGEILVEQGLISNESLETALIAQKERGIRLGAALIEMGAINERILLQNIAHQSGVPFIEPSFNMVESGLLKGMSPDYLARFPMLPFNRDDAGHMTVVVPKLDDPEVRQAVEDLFPGGVTLALGPREAIEQSIEDFKAYHVRGERLERGHSDSDADPVVQLVDHLIIQAIDEGASDIHIEPMVDVVRVRYRIDGVLVYKTDLPANMLAKIISRLKIMAECNIAEHQHHQGGHVAFSHEGAEIDMRLSIYVCVHGESVVLRILNKAMGLVTLDELGMSPNMLTRYQEDVLDPSTGVVLITGPTGSGKTTSLYSSIDYCNSADRKIITAEDPVEYTVDGIVQCSIHEKIGRGFESTLREIVRQEPDIIVLGEIRDKVTARVAIQAALTGHKVYSTFHTEDTIGGLLRLMDMETFLISSTVISVLAQRLLRRICSHCAVPCVPTVREVKALGLEMSEVREYEYRRGSGCAHCAYTGYRGRIGVYELLVLNEDVKEAILQKKPAHEIRRVSVETTGLVSMREDAIDKVLQGLTTFEEATKHTPKTFAMRPLRQIVALCR